MFAPLVFLLLRSRHRIHEMLFVVVIVIIIQFAGIAERKRISQVGHIQREPLAIWSTFELVLFCILTLIHLIEQSHMGSITLRLLFFSLCSLSLRMPFFVVAVSVVYSEVFIFQTPCLYLLSARWPKLCRRSLATEMLWRFFEFSLVHRIRICWISMAAHINRLNEMEELSLFEVQTAQFAIIWLWLFMNCCFAFGLNASRIRRLPYSQDLLIYFKTMLKWTIPFNLFMPARFFFFFAFGLLVTMDANTVWTYFIFYSM